VMNKSFGTMPLLFWCRSSSPKTCPQPPHLLQILTLLPVLFSSGSLLLLPLASSGDYCLSQCDRSSKQIDSSERQKLPRKNSKEQKTETSLTYSSATFYEKKISVSDR
jgi:hypothetical protein